MAQSQPGREMDVDVNSDERSDFLVDEVQLRQGDPSIGSEKHFSIGFVVESACERYFALLRSEESALDGLLSFEDLGVVLNTCCSPVWEWQPGFTIAGALAEDHGVEDLSEDNPMTRLIRKLSKLTPLQCAALVDVCERIWRTPASASVDESLDMPALDTR